MQRQQKYIYICAISNKLTYLLLQTFFFSNILFDFSDSKTTISTESIYKSVSICAPYLEVVEEMTLREFLEFHHGFKPFLSGVNITDIMTTVGLDKAANKQIRYYSSGMKQRVKLAQCIFSDTGIVYWMSPAPTWTRKELKYTIDLSLLIVATGW